MVIGSVKRFQRGDGASGPMRPGAIEKYGPRQDAPFSLFVLTSAASRWQAIGVGAILMAAPWRHAESMPPA
jgi:hypothetical protein